MKKQVLATLLTAAMAAGLMAGCGSSGGGQTTQAPAAETPAATAAPAEEAPADASEGASAAESTASAEGGFHFEIVSKGFQHQYWQAVLKGAEQKAAELGDTMNFVGPNTESDIADQVQMLQSAINQKPVAIGLAALDTSACLDAIASAQSAGIPIVGFDSGVPGAPDGAVVANCATDNYAAGELAAEETYKLIADRIKNADGAVRIGVMGQDATAESIINRGLGFIDKIAELATADGNTVTIEGNDKYVSDSKVEKTDGANVIIEVLVPAQVTQELSAIDCQNLLSKADTICVYGSNQHSGDAMVTANQTMNKFGSGEGQVIGVAFDSGAAIKGAVKDGTFAGAVTQAPVAMGEALVQTLHDVASGKEVKDIDTGCQWFTAENMDSPEISQNLYD